VGSAGNRWIRNQLRDNTGKQSTQHTVQRALFTGLFTLNEIIMKCFLNISKVLAYFAVFLASVANAAVSSGPILNPANGHNYFLLSSNTWTASEAEAQSLGGHLATINDAQENAWVCSTFSQAYYLWIGLNDAAVSNDYVWSSGESVSYTNWYPGEPNHFTPTERYAEIYNFAGGNFQWNDNQNISSVDSYGIHGVVEVAGTNALADSVVDFSSVQGQGGWFYGYCSNNYAVAGFQQFSAVSGGLWGTGQNVWTGLWNWGGHPNGLNGNGGRVPVLHFAVRRWVSSVAGTVLIQGVTSSCDAPGVSCNGGDTTAQLYVDGTLVFSTPVTSSAQTSYSAAVSVSVGSTVDFVIRPTSTSDVNGGTTFTGVIQQISAVPYQSFDSQSYSLRPWLGRNIVMLTPLNRTLDGGVMSQIVGALDRAWDYYGLATGRQPTPNSPTTFLGRDTVAVVSSTCGAGCSYLGLTGSELLGSSFDTLYNGVQAANQFDQVMFYEFGRNFWFYGNQLAYVSPDTDPVTTGFAVYMRFTSMDAAGVAGGPFNGHSFTTFCTTVTNLMDSYVTTATLNWSNTFRIGQAPANPLGLGGTDLIASLLMRIGRDFGGPGFSTNFWREVALRPGIATTQGAVDNFILSACAAVNQNLCGIFSTTWKFPVSASALAEAQTRWGTPIVLRPPVTVSKGAGNTILMKWQTKGNTAYQVQGSTNLQYWVDVGAPIAGDGTIRTVTNSTSGSTNRFFRLKLQ
jgi:hypothetical protein